MKVSSLPTFHIDGTHMDLVYIFCHYNQECIPLGKNKSRNNPFGNTSEIPNFNYDGFLNSMDHSYNHMVAHNFHQSQKHISPFHYSNDTFLGSCRTTHNHLLKLFFPTTQEQEEKLYEGMATESRGHGSGLQGFGGMEGS